MLIRHCMPYCCRFVQQRNAGRPPTCPLDNGVLDTEHLTPNFSLRDAILQWEAKYCKTINSAHVKILEQIGRGSFKIVYRAELRVPGSSAPTIVAALKVPSNEVAAEVSALISFGSNAHVRARPCVVCECVFPRARACVCAVSVVAAVVAAVVVVVSECWPTVSPLRHHHNHTLKRVAQSYARSGCHANSHLRAPQLCGVRLARVPLRYLHSSVFALLPLGMTRCGFCCYERR